jgi:hypothetical protein
MWLLLVCDGIIDPAFKKSRTNTLAIGPLSIQEPARNGNTERNAALVPARKVGRAPQGVPGCRKGWVSHPVRVLLAV